MNMHGDRRIITKSLKFACLFMCSLCNIFAYGNAYAYKTYEFIWKLDY